MLILMMGLTLCHRSDLIDTESVGEPSFTTRDRVGSISGGADDMIL